MLIKKHLPSSHYPASPHQGDSHKVVAVVASSPSRDNNSNDDCWPPFEEEQEQDSVCSFSSAPSFTESEDEWEYDNNNSKNKKKKKKKDLRHNNTHKNAKMVHFIDEPSSDVSQTRTGKHASSNHRTPIQPTTPSSSSTTNPRETTVRQESSFNDSSPAANITDADANNHNHNRNNNHSTSSITGELLQIGTLAVVGLVGFLVTFAVGAAMGQGRATASAAAAAKEALEQQTTSTSPSCYYDWPGGCHDYHPYYHNGGRRTLSRW